MLQSESLREGYAVTRTEIVDPAAAHAIGKPAGRYVTVDLRPYFRRQGHFFGRGEIVLDVNPDALGRCCRRSTGRCSPSGSATAA